ncbi:hypothetical protein OESDEN_16297 [Oesophagostomum dentatum]|uniref:Lipid-binding serum glycoprotein N-terminal domain-containing protein n=1 Tax=Oesophagostomum dentatum TaxID=61180 RepID=A0A0B1SJD6_OESDE|nr:hypothetical protein OESDEN_16297 [Oesophagostomum dentatum]
MLFPLLCLGALLSVSYADFNSTEPIIVSISPKIWTLLKSKDKLIKDAIKSVKLKDIDKKKGWLHVRAWDGKIDNFSVDPAGISFQDMKNGIHLRVKNVSVHATYKGRIELGRKLLGLPLRIARASGNLRLKSENGSLDIKLVWDDFKFKPTVSMTSDISVEFTKNAKMLKHLKKAIQRRSTKIHAKISEEIVKLIEEKLNPRLQELKRKAATKGISHCDAEFKVQDKILRAVCKPKK